MVGEASLMTTMRMWECWPLIQASVFLCVEADLSLKSEVAVCIHQVHKPPSWSKAGIFENRFSLSKDSHPLFLQKHFPYENAQRAVLLCCQMNGGDITYICNCKITLVNQKHRQNVIIGSGTLKPTACMYVQASKKSRSNINTSTSLDTSTTAQIASSKLKWLFHTCQTWRRNQQTDTKNWTEENIGKSSWTEFSKICIFSDIKCGLGVYERPKSREKHLYSN